jgi:hypothetical protein
MRASILVAGVLTLVGEPALADVVTSEYGAELALGPAAVQIEVRRDEARMTVRYEVRNPGPMPDEAAIELMIPEGAAITGLRYQPRRGATWIEGRLLPSTDAVARWERYRSAPFTAMRGPALVEVPEEEAPTLRLLFVPARDRVVVEYTLTAPVCHARGRWIAPAPAIVSDARTRVVVRGPAGVAAGARSVVHGAAAHDDTEDAGAPVAIDDEEILDLCAGTDPGDAWLGASFVTVAAPADQPAHGVDARMVMVPAGTQRVVEVVVDVAAQLAPAPRDAHVVFVVDASISMGAAGVAAQLEVVKAYLARSPGARFEIVVFRREAAAVTGRWRAAVDATTVLAELERRGGVFAVGNGSDLDAGLRRAVALLARTDGARRVVAFTDDRVREALDADAVRAALAGLPADAVVHVVGVDGEDAAEAAEASSLERDFEHWLAPVAARWGGIAAWAKLGGVTERARARADVFEDLVRPRRIEGVVFEQGDGGRDELGAIGEGTSVRLTRLAPDSAVTMRGFIWGRPWQPQLITSEVAWRRVAALAIGDRDVIESLEQDALRSLATIGHAVSEATSLWADDPRWVAGGLPPEVRLRERGGLVAVGGGYATCSSHCRSGLRGRVSSVATRERPDVAGLLAGPIASCAARAKMATWSVGLELETTGREVVDVRLVSGADDASFARCVIESGWSLALPEEYASWTASFDVHVVGDNARR